MDKATKAEIRRLLTLGRRQAQRLEATEKKLIGLVEDIIGADPSGVPSGAENADNLADAISCYMQYDEYKISKIIKEIEANEGRKCNRKDENK